MVLCGVQHQISEGGHTHFVKRPVASGASNQQWRSIVRQSNLGKIPKLSKKDVVVSFGYNLILPQKNTQRVNVDAQVLPVA